MTQHISKADLDFNNQIIHQLTELVHQLNRRNLYGTETAQAPAEAPKQ